MRETAATYLAEVAEPTAAAVREHAGDFSAEASQKLDATVASLTEQIATAASAPSSVEPGDGFDESDLAAVLTQRYIDGDDAAHELFDAQHATEVQRLNAMALELSSHVAALGDAAVATDGAIAESAAVGAGMHQAILDANPLASTAAKDALAASVSALQAIAGAEGSDADEAGAALTATTPSLFTAHGAAAAEVRASQVANTPAPKTPVAKNGGGGSNAPFYCSRYDHFFGLIWAPC